MPVTDQEAVWREVSRKLRTTGSSSASDALQDVFLNYQRRLGEFVERLPEPAECNGAVFVVGGRIARADLFDKPDTLRKLWPKLIKSCTIDALEPSTQSAGPMAQEQVSSWLEAAANATLESFPSPGVGQDVRIEGEDVIGASLVVDEHPVHMELFRPLSRGGPTRANRKAPNRNSRRTPGGQGFDLSLSSHKKARGTISSPFIFSSLVVSGRAAKRAGSATGTSCRQPGSSQHRR